MAEIKPSYDTKRAKLSEIIPLKSPLSMYIEPTRICNLKCFYCMHGTRGTAGGELERTGFSLEHIRPEVYHKIVQGMMEFPEQPKRICFSGLGEPLANPHLPQMIKQLRAAGFSGRIDVISNGLLLNTKMSDALIEAGISRIQISLQGLSAEQYEENCGVKVDFNQLIENLRYFHEHKKDATIFIKIIDALLKSDEEEKLFYANFSNLCDTIFIEHLVIMQQQMGDHDGRTDKTRNLNGEWVAPREVCGVMFYFLQVNIDGETFPCSTPGLPPALSMGNMNQASLLQIWNGERRKQMIRTNLRHGYRAIPPCKECSSCVAIADDTEYLDDCREEMLTRFPE